MRHADTVPRPYDAPMAEVVLTEPGAVAWDDDLLAATRDGVESRVVLGTRVGVRGRRSS